MPNHITNIVKYEGDADRIKEMLEQIKVDEFGIGTIDFNKLIPMPESLNIESGSRTDRGLKAYKEFLEIYTFGRKVENLDLLVFFLLFFQHAFKGSDFSILFKFCFNFSFFQFIRVFINTTR